MMADNELNIKVNADSRTIAQLESEIKKLRAEFKNAAIGSDEFSAAGKELKSTLEAKSKAMEAAETQTAKTMKSYFTLGERLRQFYTMQEMMGLSAQQKLSKANQGLYTELTTKINPAFTGLNQVIQDAPFGIRGVGNNIQFLTQQFTQLRASGLSTKDILQGMIGNIMTPMGGLMFAVSAGTSLLTVAMDNLSTTSGKAAEELKKSSDELYRLNVSLGDVSHQKNMEILTTNVERVRSALNKPLSTSDTVWAAIRAGLFVSTGGSFGSLPTNEKALIERTLGIKQAESDRNKEIRSYVESKEEELQLAGNSTELNVSALMTLRNLITEQKNLVYGKEEERYWSLEILKINERIADAREKSNKTAQSAEKAESAKRIKDAQYAEDFFAQLDAEKAEREKKDAEDLQKSYDFEAELIWARDAEEERQMTEWKRRIKEKERDQHESIRQWKEENQTAMVATNAIGAGIRSLGQSILGTTRQAVDQWDAAWLAMQNTAVNALSAIAEKIAEAAILDLFVEIGLMSTPAGVGSFLGKIFGFADGGWIPEPVVGIGASGNRYMFGERGPEYVSSNSNIQAMMQEKYSGGGGYSIKPSVQVVPIISNQGLAVQVRIGEQQRNKRTLQ